MSCRSRPRSALTLRAADRRPTAAVALWGAPPPAAGPQRAAPRASAAAIEPFAASSPSDEAGRPGPTVAAGAVPRAPRLARDSRRPGARRRGASSAPQQWWTPRSSRRSAAPRPAALDALVAGHDLVVVAAAPDTALAGTAVERLADRGVPAVACRPLGRGLVRALAVAGWAAPRRRADGRRAVTRAAGQASVLLVGAMAAVLAGVLVLGAVARGVAQEAAAQRAADLAALAGARAMHAATPRLFEPPLVDGRPNPRHLDRAAYLGLARAAAARVAAANGAGDASVALPGRRQLRARPRSGSA